MSLLAEGRQPVTFGGRSRRGGAAGDAVGAPSELLPGSRRRFDAAPARPGSSPGSREALGTSPDPTTRVCRSARLDEERTKGGETCLDRGVAKPPRPRPEERSQSLRRRQWSAARRARFANARRASTARRRCALARRGTVAPRGAPLPSLFAHRVADDRSTTRYGTFLASRVECSPRAMPKTRRRPRLSNNKAGGALA